MHEHVAEEPPDLCTVSGMIHQRTLHEIRLVGLQHPFIEHHAVTHKHYDLKHTNSIDPVNNDKILKKSLHMCYIFSIIFDTVGFYGPYSIKGEYGDHNRGGKKHKQKQKYAIC